MRHLTGRRNPISRRPWPRPAFDLFEFEVFRESGSEGGILLTVGHPFVDYKTCKAVANAKSCTFSTLGNPPIPVEKIISSGNKCPRKGDLDADWAILKLKRPVVGVKPYGLEERSSRDGVVNRPVIAIGDHSVDFRRTDSKTGQVTQPKHIQDCEIKRVYYRYNPVSVGSNCDGSSGKSGGALLGGNLDDHVIVGITIGTSFSDAEKALEERTGVPIRKNYDDDNWNDGGLAIDGRLRDQLIEATK